MDELIAEMVKENIHKGNRLLEKAGGYAWEVHRGNDRFMFNVRVFEILLDTPNFDTEYEILSAALLHDCQDIRNRFGPNIHQLVCQVNEGTSNLSDGAKAILLAKKIAKVEMILKKLPDGWDLQRVRDYCQSALEQQVDPHPGLYSKLKDTISKGDTE